jgi:hypothetical protein
MAGFLSFGPTSTLWPGSGAAFNRSAADIAAARDTAMNPAVLDAVALAIIAYRELGSYADLAGHQPDAATALKNAAATMNSARELRKIAAKCWFMRGGKRLLTVIGGTHSMARKTYRTRAFTPRYPSHQLAVNDALGWRDVWASTVAPDRRYQRWLRPSGPCRRASSPSRPL